MGGCDRSDKYHVPLDEYKQNLRAIVQHVRGAGCNTTVLITPPPICERARQRDRKKWGERADAGPERTNEITGDCRKGFALKP